MIHQNIHLKIDVSIPTVINLWWYWSDENGSRKTSIKLWLYRQEAETAGIPHGMVIRDWMNTVLICFTLCWPKRLALRFRDWNEWKCDFIIMKDVHLQYRVPDQPTTQKSVIRGLDACLAGLYKTVYPLIDFFTTPVVWSRMAWWFLKKITRVF